MRPWPHPLSFWRIRLTRSLSLSLWQRCYWKVFWLLLIDEIGVVWAVSKAILAPTVVDRDFLTDLLACQRLGWAFLHIASWVGDCLPWERRLLSATWGMTCTFSILKVKFLELWPHNQTCDPGYYNHSKCLWCYNLTEKFVKYHLFYNWSPFFKVW